MFVRAVDIVRAEAYLPPLGTARRAGYVILAVDLVHVRTLHAEAAAEGGAVLETAVPYLHRLTLDRLDIGAQFGDVERTLAVHHIHAPVVVEEEPRVVEILREDSPLPRALGTLGRAYREMALLGTPAVGRAEADVELAVAVAYGARPRPVEIERAALHVVTRIIVIALHGIAGHTPVDHILRRGDWTPRHIVHARRHHVEVVAHAYYVGIGPIAPHDGVGEGAVTVVGRPYLLRRRTKRRRTKKHAQKIFHCITRFIFSRQASQPHRART